MATPSRERRKLGVFGAHDGDLASVAIFNEIGLIEKPCSLCPMPSKACDNSEIERETEDGMVFDWSIALGIAGVIGTPISIVAFWLYLRDRPRVQLRYEMRVTTLIGGTEVELPSEILISFRGVPLTVLRKATLKVWNTGTQAIRESDVARPIRMTLPTDAFIFTEGVARQSVPENEVRFTRLEETSNILSAAFYYLEVGQDFNVEVLYTGSEAPLSVTATIINMRTGMINVDNALKLSFYGWLTTMLIVSTFFLTATFFKYVKIDAAYELYVVLIAASTPPCIIMVIALLKRRYQEALSPPPHLRF